MNNYAFFFISLFFLCLSACKLNKNTNPVLHSGKRLEKATLMGKLTESFPTSANYKINDVSLDGNYLYLSFEYFASCDGEDKFEFYGTLPDVSVYPPQRKIKFVVIPSSDTCKSLEYRAEIVNVSEFCFEKTPNDVIDLLLQGWKNKITYQYIGTAVPKN